jgi:hypothetical protein
MRINNPEGSEYLPEEEDVKRTDRNAENGD